MLTDTELAQIKRRAINYINDFRDVVGLEKAKACALILAQKLQESHERKFDVCNYNSIEEAGIAYDRDSLIFDQLKKAINAY